MKYDYNISLTDSDKAKLKDKKVLKSDKKKILKKIKRYKKEVVE